MLKKVELIINLMKNMKFNKFLIISLSILLIIPLLLNNYVSVYALETEVKTSSIPNTSAKSMIVMETMHDSVIYSKNMNLLAKSLMLLFLTHLLLQKVQK